MIPSGIRDRLRDVKLVVFDVDGTLTDGTVHFDDAGNEHKQFHIADGLGFRLAALGGLRLAIVSARQSPIVERRMNKLPREDVVQAAGDKATVVREIASRHGVDMSQVLFVGDDLNDLLAFEVVGVRVAVSSAVEKVRQRADWITELPGGRGAAREVIDAILECQGALDIATERYLQELRS